MKKKKSLEIENPTIHVFLIMESVIILLCKNLNVKFMTIYSLYLKNLSVMWQYCLNGSQYLCEYKGQSKVNEERKKQQLIDSSLGNWWTTLLCQHETGIIVRTGDTKKWTIKEFSKTSVSVMSKRMIAWYIQWRWFYKASLLNHC